MAVRKSKEMIIQRQKKLSQKEKYRNRVGTRQIRNLTDNEYIAMIKQRYQHI